MRELAASQQQWENDEARLRTRLAELEDELSTLDSHFEHRYAGRSCSHQNDSKPAGITERMLLSH